MPLARPKVPRDSDDVIEIRERNKPADMSTVLAKTADGVIVLMLNGGQTYRWPDGKERPYAPWYEPVDEDIAKKLKDGVVEQYTFAWLNTWKPWLVQQQGMPRWRPVKKKDNLVYCPYSTGDETDGQIHMVDTMLHYRDRAFSERVQRQEAMMRDPQRYLNDKQAEVEDNLARASGGRVKNVVQTVEPVESDAVTYVQDPDAR